MEYGLLIRLRIIFLQGVTFIKHGIEILKNCFMNTRDMDNPLLILIFLPHEVGHTLYYVMDDFKRRKKSWLIFFLYVK